MCTKFFDLFFGKKMLIYGNKICTLQERFLFKIVRVAAVLSAKRKLKISILPPLGKPVNALLSMGA